MVKKKIIFDKERLATERKLASDLYEAALFERTRTVDITNRLEQAIAAYEKYWYNKGS